MITAQEARNRTDGDNVRKIFDGFLPFIIEQIENKSHRAEVKVLANDYTCIHLTLKLQEYGYEVDVSGCDSFMNADPDDNPWEHTFIIKW